MKQLKGQGTPMHDGSYQGTVGDGAYHDLTMISRLQDDQFLNKVLKNPSMTCFHQGQFLSK
eukprot:12922082-Prorocentrum_lima.AAC.1